MKIEKVGAKNAIDIFCGKQCSFYINDKHQLFAWGLNNHGQLGIGSKFDQSNPVRVKELDPYEGDYVVEVSGGEHHSIARTKDGLVYCWGRNDEGQLGLGDTYGDYLKQKAAKEAAEQAAPSQPAAAETDDKPKNKKKQVVKEDDLKYIFYFYRPQLVEDLWKWELSPTDDVTKVRKPAKQVVAAGHYSYAICDDGVYSWGMGENFVLGSRQEDNEFRPYKLDPRMFETNYVRSIALGTQHCVALTKNSSEPDAPVAVVEPKPVAAVNEVKEQPVKPVSVKQPPANTKKP